MPGWRRGPTSSRRCARSIGRSPTGSASSTPPSRSRSARTARRRALRRRRHDRAEKLVDSRRRGHTARMTAPASRLAKASWALYDCGNSAFSAVIVTFVFATYFSQGIAESPVAGTAAWGWAMTVSALAIAVLSPIFGAIADIGGRRKPWLVGFTLATILGSALLWFAQPPHDFIVYTLIVVILANIAFEVAAVFYNAMLPET